MELKQINKLLVSGKAGKFWVSMRWIVIRQIKLVQSYIPSKYIFDPTTTTLIMSRLSLYFLFHPADKSCVNKLFLVLTFHTAPASSFCGGCSYLSWWNCTFYLCGWRNHHCICGRSQNLGSIPSSLFKTS